LGKLFEKFLSCKQRVEVFPPSRNTRNNQLYLSPYLKEISCQIQKLKNHKSSGKDEVVAELLKIEGGELTQRIWKIITKVWETEKISKDRKTAINSPLPHTKGRWKGLQQLPRNNTLKCSI